MKTLGYAAHSAESPLVPFHFDRREPRANDVVIEILYAGVCHSDLHTVRNDWGGTVYPAIPGHEIVGRVIETGSDVTKYKVGDNVAVGCLVDGCLECDQCEKHQEQFCREGLHGTYNAPDRIDGTNNYGGYSRHIVVREEFVLGVPDGMDLSRAAPILCAGITTYAPLKRWGVKEGSRVGVIGLGGLGHMAVKLAAAMGAHVTAISRTADKAEEAAEMGAHGLLISGDAAAMQAASMTFDVIIDTVPVKHDLNPYMPLLDIDGMLVIVGQLGPVGEFNTATSVLHRTGVVGSLIGGIAETQEVLDFCAEKGVLPECEMIAIQDINEAYDRLEKGDVRYRFVIDMASLEAETA
jgi:uncharacterized zinc-type alcohol dehydrogenase-like protein